MKTGKLYYVKQDLQRGRTSVIHLPTVPWQPEATSRKRGRRPKKNHNFDAAGGKQTAKRPLYSCDWEKGTLGRGIEKRRRKKKSIR